MNIADIARTLGYEYAGNEDENISGVSLPDMAGENDIAIVKREPEIFATRARVVLTEPRIVITDKSMLYTHEPIYVSAVRIAGLLIMNGEREDYSQPVSYKPVCNFMAGEDINFGENVSVGVYSTIGNRVKIGSNSIIEPGVFIGSDVVIGEGVIIHSGAKIGAASFYHYEDNNILKTFCGTGTVIISDNAEIGYNTAIQRGSFGNTFIGHDTKIGNCVDIGHDVFIGNNCKIVSQVGIAGNAVIGDGVKIFGQSGVANFVRIGNGAKIMAKTLVTKNVKPGGVVSSGIFSREHAKNLRLHAELEKLSEVM